MIEEEGYDSDIIDEEEMARLYESVYYNDVPGMENFALPRGSNSQPVTNFLQKPLMPKNVEENGEDSKECNSDGDSQSDSSTEGRVDSPMQNPLENINCSQEDIEALTLLITGQTPQSVLDKAAERLRLYGKKKPTTMKFVRSSHSDDSDSDQSSGDGLSEESSRESKSCDIVIGMKNCPSHDLRHSRKYIPEDFKNLPSDPKYWSIDSEGFYDHRKGFDFNKHKEFTCYCCGKKGHSHYRCPKACCSLCHQFGHNSENCKRVNQIRRAKCTRCRQKGHEESTCPDVWRQYRYTTKPGPPVRKPTSRADQEENRRSVSRYFGPIPICKYDDHDVYAKARVAVPTDGELKSSQKVRNFDEPVYLSFNGKASSSAPVRNTPKDMKGKRKSNDFMKKRRRLSVPSTSTPGTNAKKLKKKRKFDDTNHQRKRLSGPTSSIPANTGKSELSERPHRNSLPSHVLNFSNSPWIPDHFSGQSFGNSRYNSSNPWRNRMSGSFTPNHISFGNTPNHRQGKFSGNFNRDPPAKGSGPLKRKSPGHDFKSQALKKLKRSRKSSQSNASPGRLPNILNSPYLKLVVGGRRS